MPNDKRTWDFFIAHAGADKPAAEALYSRLALGSRVFLDSKCLKLGDDWDIELPAAQGQSLITIVLISPNTDSAYYQREEIAAAIALARSADKKYRVIPIYLGSDGSAADKPPYGLKLKHGIAVSNDSDLATAAERLLDLLDSLQGSPEWLKYAPKPPTLAEGKQWHAYLSYRARNRAWVIKLYEALGKAGFKSWFDYREITAAENVQSSLEKALLACTGGIFVYSSEPGWAEDEYRALAMRTQTDPEFRFVVIAFEADLPFILSMSNYFLEDPEYPSGPGLLRIMYGLAGMSIPIEAVKFIARTTEETNAELHTIAGSRIIGDQARLQELGTGASLAWVTSPLIACRAAEALLELGADAVALDVLSRAAEYFHGSLRLRQLRALTLARMGQSLDAHRLIADIYAAGHRDLDTLLILARTWMGRYTESRKRLHLEKSRSLYVEAFTVEPMNYYAGLNAAAKSVLLGERDVAYRYAKDVESALERSYVSLQHLQHLKIWTLAEIKLIREDYGEAARLYKEAIIMDPEAIGLHKDYLAEARMLMEALNTPAEERLRMEQFMET